MVVLTAQFATLLVLVATAQAAFVPQRPASEPQIHFRARSTANQPSPLDFIHSLGPLGNIFSRRSTASPSNPEFVSKEPGRKPKPKGKGRFGAASVPAPIPNSAKPASERDNKTVGHTVAAPFKAAQFAEGPEKHAGGEYRRYGIKGPYKGYKNSQPHGEHSVGQKDEKFGGYMGGHRGHKGQEYQGDHHEDKRGTIEASVSFINQTHEPENARARPRVNSRLFRIGNDHSSHAKKAVDDHAHDHDHVHVHDHVHDHDHDHDHDHNHDHDHDHKRRDVDDLVDYVLDSDIGADLNFETRALRDDSRHHARDGEEDILYAKVNIKRRHRLQARKHYPLVIHNVKSHKHATYPGHGKRDHDHEHIHDRRDAPVGVPGFIQIVSPTASGGSVKIANLVLASVDNSTSFVKNASFVLNASNDTQTKVFLVAAPDSTSTNGVAHVSLQLPMFDRMQIKDVPSCVTYDPKPSAPGPLTVKPCTQDSAHQSQLFEFSTLTGSVKPIWQSAVGEASDVASELPFEREPVLSEAAAADFAIASGSNTTTNSTSAASESNAASHPRSVALLFAPEDPQAPKVASEDIAPNNGTVPSSPAAASISTSKTSTHTADSSTALVQEVRTSSSSKSDSSFTQAGTTSTSSVGLSAAAVKSTSSTAASSSATGSPSPSKVLAAAVTPTPSDASATGRVVDAAAPYEWMFTPGSQD